MRVSEILSTLTSNCCRYLLSPEIEAFRKAIPIVHWTEDTEATGEAKPKQSFDTVEEHILRRREQLSGVDLHQM